MSTKNYRWAWSSLAMPLVFAVVLVVLFFPLDGVISKSLKDLKLGPDFRVELQTIQQYGQLSATLIGMALIWLLDSSRRRRLLDWLAAIGVTSFSCFLLKMSLGRPRPKFDDPTSFVGIFDAYPFATKTGDIVYRYAWDLTNRHPWDLWSMPSSHAAAAAVMSVFLVYLYPRLRPFGVTMVVLVGCCRVLFRDHYPTDVVVGVAVGYVITHYAVTLRWGQRTWDWVRWRRERENARETSVSIAD